MTTEAVAAPGNSPPDTGALRALAGVPDGAGVADLSTLVHPRLVPPAVLRPATVADVEALCAMHRRCSPDSRSCRYLVVTKEVSPANVRRLLTETATTVAEALDGQLVAMGNVCLGGAEAELALLVEGRVAPPGPGRVPGVCARRPGGGIRRPGADRHGDRHERRDSPDAGRRRAGSGNRRRRRRDPGAAL